MHSSKVGMEEERTTEPPSCSLSNKKLLCLTTKQQVESVSHRSY